MVELSNRQIAVWLNRQITGSPAGLSRVNGDGPSSAKMVKFNRLPKSQLWIVCFQIWQGWLCQADQQPCKILLRSYERWRPHVVVEYQGRVPFIIIFSFIATRTAQTREPIPTHNSSKDVVWRKEVPSKQEFFEILTLWGSFSPENPTNLADSREIPAEMERSNNS